jgi:hypothetical protein
MRFLKEPLLHFLLLGVALFILFGWVGNDPDGPVDERTEIVVTMGRINSLGATFEKVWQRPPSPEELTGLVNDFIREEIMYREALAMGLDQDDTIVRRRMRQKIEFLSDDVANLIEPSEEELQAFLDTHPERFEEDDRYSFQQVYFDLHGRGESALDDARAALSSLRAGELGPEDLGDSLMIELQFEDLRETDIKRTFGGEFLQAIETVPKGSWQGPVASGYGLHLVLVDHRVDGFVPLLAEIRDTVFREWSVEKRKEFTEAFYARLRERYIVTIEES